MVKSRERGSGTMWGMIVFIVTTLVFVVMYYQESDRATKLANDLASQTTAASQRTEQFTKANQKLLDLTDTTGFSDAEQHPDKEKMQGALDTYKAELPALLAIEFESFKWTPTGQQGTIEKIGQGTTRINYLASAELSGVKTWEGLYPQYKTAAQRLISDYRLAINVIGELQASLKANREANEQATATLQAQIDDLRGQLTQQQASAAQEAQDLNDRIATLQTQLDTATSTAETQKAEFEAQITALTNELNQKRAEVVRLNDRARPYLTEGPDGAVLTAGNGIVVIDRGRADYLMPGTIFTVMGRRKGGSTFVRGSIKVVTCDDDTARCTAVEGGGFLPGDLIQSLTYSPNEKLNFAFVGEFKKMGRGDAMARMKALGSAIHEKVLPTTHYLVVGTPSPGVENIEDTEHYRRAKEYGIKIITEDMLASFTRY